MADGTEEEDGHLTAEGFDRLRRAELTPAELIRLGTHLLRACPPCCERIAPLVAASRGRTPEDEARPSLHELPIARALASFRTELLTLQTPLAFSWLALATLLEGKAGEEAHEVLSARTPEGRRAWCELLLEHAAKLRTVDPAVALEVARLAVALAESLHQGPYPSRPSAELQARAWMELGNLLRASAGKLKAADAAFRLATAYLDAAGAPPGLVARLGDLYGSLYRDWRRFPEALEVLDRAEQCYLQLGERHLAGRTLINKATVYRNANEPEQALRALDEALGLLDWSRDPGLVLAALHDSMLAWTDAGRPEQAFKVLWFARPFYDEVGTTLDRVRLLGAEGLIAAAQGRLRRAEGFFRQEKAGFEREGLAYDGALVALDLAEVLLKQRRAGEVLALVEEMTETFFRLEITREAIATLAVLRQAVELGEATAVHVREAARELNRLVVRPPASLPEE